MIPAVDPDSQSNQKTAPQYRYSSLLAEREKRLDSGESHLMELDDFITAMHDGGSSSNWHENILHERLASEERGEAIWRSVDETFARIRTLIADRRQLNGR